MPNNWIVNCVGSAAHIDWFCINDRSIDARKRSSRNLKCFCLPHRKEQPYTQACQHQDSPESFKPKTDYYVSNHRYGMRRPTSSLIKRIIIENMDRRIFHGDIKPKDIAQALLAEFNRGNLHAQVVGQAEKMAVQISTRRGVQSG